MRPTASLALLLLASGCWKLDDPAVGYDIIPLDNQHVVNPDLVVQTFEPTPPLKCPDGSSATFYAVYDTKLAGAVPLAVVFHSGAFDYVKNPAQDDFLAGTHFAPEDRLDLEWAQLRVFSTLGMWEEQVDPNETHTGALVTALAQEGIMVLLPANCWGDLWHGYQGRQDNDYSTERFSRNGLAFASWMLQVATDTSFATQHDVGLPLPVDSTQIALVGLGDGGRAVGELLWLEAESSNSIDVSAILVDSSPDDLTAYYEQSALFADDITGFERIWGDDIDEIGARSVEAFLEQSQYPLPARTVMVWSMYDPEVLTGAQQGLNLRVEAMQEADPDAAWVDRESSQAHVFTNKDVPLAFEVVRFLFP
ncbi:MAG: hypothetical protein ABIO70_12005 [Pseudomonadota bacterium]